MPVHPRRHALMLPLVLGSMLLPGTGQAKAEPKKVGVGILNDQNGPFADQSGRGSVVAAQLAIEEFSKEDAFIEVDLHYDDHQNKPDLARQIVGNWLDNKGVDVVADVPNSAVGLAINDLIHSRNKTFLATNVGTSDLTGKFCQPTTVQWSFDTWAFGNSAAQALYKKGPFYFISFEYALGKALVRDTTAALKRLGGSVAGDVEHPLGTTDFSSYLLQARSSGAKVVAFADTGMDFVNAIKQATEFGVNTTATLAGLLTEITDVEAIGLKAAQGLIVTEAFYWDLNDQTRDFTRRFANVMPERVPTENQAGVYSSVLAYLRAVRATGSKDGDKVVAAMKAHPIQDTLFGTVTVRPDGRAIHPMYVFRVKSPAESRGRWDLYALAATIPADEAFRPLNEGGCPLVR